MTSSMPVLAETREQYEAIRASGYTGDVVGPDTYSFWENIIADEEEEKAEMKKMEEERGGGGGGGGGEGGGTASASCFEATPVKQKGTPKTTPVKEKNLTAKKNVTPVKAQNAMPIKADGAMPAKVIMKRPAAA